MSVDSQWNAFVKLCQNFAVSRTSTFRSPFEGSDSASEVIRSIRLRSRVRHRKMRAFNVLVGIGVWMATMTTHVQGRMLNCYDCQGDGYNIRQTLGTLENSDIYEASGIVKSRRNPGVFYTHNDNSGDNRIFAFDSNGKHLAVFTLGIGGDWEDLAIGPGPGGKSYLYVGDIGNANGEGTKYIYRVSEPWVDVNSKSYDYRSLTNVDVIRLVYPYYANKDSETLLIDTNGDICLVEKDAGQPLRLWRAKYPQKLNNEDNLLETDIEENSFYGEQFTGGDSTESGTKLIIKSYSHVFLWEKRNGTNLKGLIKSGYREVPYVPEQQGEAICFDVDEKGYYTLSEGGSPTLYYYPLQ